MLRTGGQNELCHKYLLLKLMPLVAIYKKAVQREHSVYLVEIYVHLFLFSGAWSMGGTAIMSVTSHLCGEVPFMKGWNIFENGPVQIVFEWRRNLEAFRVKFRYIVFYKIVRSV